MCSIVRWDGRFNTKFRSSTGRHESDRMTPLRDHAYKLYFWYLHQNSETETVNLSDLHAEFYTNNHRQAIFGRIDDERPVFEDIETSIKKSDVFYDVGAQYGVFSCLIGNELRQGEVIAFEPMIGPYHRLRYNIALNNVNGSAYRYALTGQNLSSTDWLDQSGADIPLISGDELRSREQVSAPDVIKIDVEGGELDALNGLSETISKSSCRLIYCEVHPAGCFEMDGYEDVGLTDSEITELYNTIERWGFSVETIHQRGEQSFIRAEREI